ncbi:MAG: SHOCT domain-containing protein [Lachnospiraceae bacterium]|nr:SHOCT domain-containing protein [Lachnospiraceae bacterium]
MGLFGPKKTCSICGGKVGFFGYDLSGNDHLCGNCRDKCTPGQLDFASMSVDDIRKNMEVAEANKAKADDFQATKEFYAGSHFDKPILFVDEENGWFMNAAKGDGWVYNLDDITYYNMRINTSRNEEEQKEKGFLEWLFEPDFYSDFPELPKVPDGEKLTGAYLTIRLAENELGVDEVEIDVFPGFFTDENDVRSSYLCCHDFYTFMQDYRAGQRSGGRGTAASRKDESKEDPVELLKKLHGLVEAGILTQEEFEAKKKQILEI